MAIENVAECISTGQCVVMSKQIYIVFISIGALAAILLLMLILVAFMTPALIFLKAKFVKGSLIYEFGRSQIGRFLIAKVKHQGVADVKNVGAYIITENSHTIESRSKTPIYLAFGEFGATLPLEYAAIVQSLREQGEKVTNVTDLAGLIGMQFNEVTKVWEQVQEDKLTAEQKQRIKNLTAEITPKKTIHVCNLAYMFPFNITPALIESKTQHLLGIKMGMFNKMNMQYVLMFIMILMGATLAAVIAFKFLKTGDATGARSTTTIIERVVQVSNLTG